MMRIRKPFGFVERQRLARDLAVASVVKHGLLRLFVEPHPPKFGAEEVPGAFRWKGDGPPETPAGVGTVDVTLDESDMQMVAVLAGRWGRTPDQVVALAGARGAREWRERTNTNGEIE